MNDVKSLFLSLQGKKSLGGGKKLLFSLLSLFMATLAYAQDITVNGTVVDDTGEPVIGATVMVEGTSNGTTTDLDGNFSLKVAKNAKLKITYIGYDPQTLPAKNGMKVVLKTNSVVLGGVEVVAYGVQKKVTVTGAIASVKGEELTRTPVASVNNVLAGQLTGVTTVQTSGEPGADAATIYVRGKGTWAKDGAKPLIQVDGVERSMEGIDPEDIESITVLKDASATAVFGVRGANGVILITTKRGKEGQARVDVSTSFSLVTPTEMVKQASSYEYATFYNQMQLNDYEGPMESFTPQFSDEIIQKFKDGSDPIRFPSIRWADYTMKKRTLQTKSNVNISGGTKDVRYYVSAGLMTQGGMFKEFGYDEGFSYNYERFNYRANLDLDVTPTTTITLGVAGLISNQKRPRSGEGTTALIRAMYQAVPFSSAGIIDGRPIFTTTDVGADGLALPINGGSGFTYILGSGNTGGAYHDNYNKLETDLQLNQKLDFITKGLSFRAKGSYNSQFGVRKEITVNRATYNPVMQPDGSILYRKNGNDDKPAYKETPSKARDWYAEAALNYNRTFGFHTVGALVLYNQSKTYYPKEFSDIPQGYVGLVGRVTYDYDNRYMAEFNIGYNGSENFHPDRRFGTFPAGSIGWIISNEKFFQPVTKVVDFLKFRASIGLVGNDKIAGTRFMYTSDPFGQNTDLAARPAIGYAYNFGIDNTTSTPGWVELQKNNPDVGWEKALKQDYGVDIYVLNSRLRANFDYYREHRTNILLQDLTAPSYVGYAVPYANLGVVDSWGWEVSLQWNDKINNDWRYWVNVNLSHNQNKIKEMKEAPLNNDYQYQKGHRIGARSQYKFFRFYDSETPALYEATFGKPYPEQLMELKDGDAVYVDLDGDGKITPNDMTRALGYTDDPQYVAGLNFGVVWKGLELSMQWTGAWGVSRMIEDVFRNPFQSRTGNNDGGLLSYHLTNTWNPDAPGQNYEYPRASWTHYNNNYATSTLYEKDAKYLRMKTVQLSYTIDAPFVKKIGMRNMMVALSGYNLLTFTPYKWGDPESVGSALPQYPVQKTYTVTLKLNF